MTNFTAGRSNNSRGGIELREAKYAVNEPSAFLPDLEALSPLPEIDLTKVSTIFCWSVTSECENHPK